MTATDGLQSFIMCSPASESKWVIETIHFKGSLSE